MSQSQPQALPSPGDIEPRGPRLTGRIVSFTDDSLTLSYNDKGKELYLKYSLGPQTKKVGKLVSGKFATVFYREQDGKNIAILIKIIEEKKDMRAVQSTSNEDSPQTSESQKSKPADSGTSKTPAPPSSDNPAGPRHQEPGPGGQEPGGPRYASDAPSKKGGSALPQPSLEVSGAYNYLRMAGVNCHGGSGSIAYNVDDPVWAVAQVGVCKDTGLPTGTSGHVITYLFGPRIKLSSSSKFAPYGQLLIGGAQSGGTGGASASALAVTLGAGADLKINEHISFRVAQAEYLLTRFRGGQQNNFGLESGIVFRFGPK